MTSVLGLTPLRFFWLLFFVSAVWLQLFFPEMDFFAPGILLCLQRERLRNVCILVFLAILIQEGTGPLVFGSGVLRYGGLMGLFFLGRVLFESQSPIFIVLLSLIFTFLHIIILQTMAGLQSLDISGQQFLWESLLVFGTFLLDWFVLNTCYRIFSRHESLA